MSANLQAWLSSNVTHQEKVVASADEPLGQRIDLPPDEFVSVQSLGLPKGITFPGISGIVVQRSQIKVIGDNTFRSDDYIVRSEFLPGKKPNRIQPGGNLSVPKKTQEPCGVIKINREIHRGFRIYGIQKSGQELFLRIKL